MSKDDDDRPVGVGGGMFGYFNPFDHVRQRDVVSPFPPGWQDYQQAQANPVPSQTEPYANNPFDHVRPPGSHTDALLGELLREVQALRQQVAALQDTLGDITDAMRTTRIRLDHLSGVSANSLRHGTPR